jgi:hypothetical protein
MSDGEHLHSLKPLTGVAYGISAAGILMVLAVLATFAPSRRADALPSYAQQTGLACGRCHVNPAGGGPRTAFGNAFAANGHKVPAKSGKAGEPAKPGKASEPAKPGEARVYVRPAPWETPKRCNGWCLRRD